MWNTELTRKALIELVMGVRKTKELDLHSVTGIKPGSDPTLFYAYWQEQPVATLPLPNLLIASSDTITDLLVALNASPTAPSPITAICRILTRQEAFALFEESLLDTKQDISVAMLALSIAEAVLLADGRLAPRHATPAMCKRTLSFAWGKALLAQVPPQIIQELPRRWADTYASLNVEGGSGSFQSVVSDLTGPLGVCAHLAMGVKPPGAIGELTYSTFHGDDIRQQNIWQQLSSHLSEQRSIREIAAATREERGLYLQAALKTMPPKVPALREEYMAVCAFLATQVAPGSLEHLELLKVNGTSSMVLWYALFAAIQSPTDVLMGVPGVGHRILRELNTTVDLASRPTADIAFSEFRILERAGIETIARRFGHVGEVEIELLPGITSIFSLPGRNRGRAASEQLALEMDNHVMPPKARMQQLIQFMSDAIREMPDDGSVGTVPSKKSYPANKRSRAKGESR